MWARRHLRPLPQIPTLEAPRWGAVDAPRWERFATWLRRPWLDPALAAGADPAASPLLAQRAAALVSRANRNRLAPPTVAQARVRPLRGSPAAPYCPGMARAWRLITDGCGPLYAAPSPAELDRELGAVLAALRGGS